MVARWLVDEGERSIGLGKGKTSQVLPPCWTMVPPPVLGSGGRVAGIVTGWPPLLLKLKLAWPWLQGLPEMVVSLSAAKISMSQALQPPQSMR